MSAAKTGNLSLIPKTWMVEENSRLHQAVLGPSHMCHGTHTHMHAKYINKHNFKGQTCILWATLAISLPGIAIWGMNVTGVTIHLLVELKKPTSWHGTHTSERYHRPQRKSPIIVLNEQSNKRTPTNILLYPHREMYHWVSPERRLLAVDESQLDKMQRVRDWNTEV